MKKGKIHLGVLPSYDLGGKLVSNMFFDNMKKEIHISMEKGMKVNSIKITYEDAISNGLLNLEILDFYFNKF